MATKPVKAKRIFYQIDPWYARETPNVQPIGKKNAPASYQPVIGTPKVLELDEVEELVQKGVAVLIRNTQTQGNTMSDGYQPDPVAVEHDQYDFVITASGEGGVIRLGLEDNNIGVFNDDGSPLAVMEGVTLSGQFGSKALDTFGRLMRYGQVDLDRLHFTCDDVEFFNTPAKYKEYTHTGTIKHDARLNFPKATSGDENINIREMLSEFLKQRGVKTFNGLNFIEIKLPPSAVLSLTAYTKYWAR